MSHASVMNSSQMFAAAMALSAAGFLVSPTPAQADPLFPLAPPCSEFGFTGGFSLRQANGFQVFFSATGPVASGKAVAVGDDNVTKLTGPVSGGIKGRNVDFTILWDSGGAGHYTGTVGDDAFAHGVTGGTPWDSTSRLGCITPVPPLAPIPIPASDLPKVPKPDKTPAPATPPVATVTSDVDIYAAPGGNGTPIGVLRKGRQVKLATDNGLPAPPGQTCLPNDWCHVVLPELPAGSGWVWGQYLAF